MQIIMAAHMCGLNWHPHYFATTLADVVLKRIGGKVLLPVWGGGGGGGGGAHHLITRAYMC